MSESLSIIALPFLAGLIVLIGHVPLGREVLRRGIIFIDLCIAQVAALGLVIAQHSGWGADIESHIVAATSAVSVGLLLGWTERRWPRLQEALIGSIYVVSAAAALLLLSRDPHGEEALNTLLAGQLLWVDQSGLWPLLATSILVLIASATNILNRRYVFYVVFALAVTASVQMIGVFLVFASLILPALGTQSWQSPGGLMIAWVLGASGYAGGLLLSLYMDLPSGPAVICVLATLALVTAISLSRHRAS